MTLNLISEFVRCEDLLSPRALEVFSCAEFNKGILDLFDREDCEHALTRIERSPHLLEGLDPFARENRRLGRYFERILKTYLLVSNPNWRIYSNVQVKFPHAQGELDFVLAELTKTIHLEVALKFYLCVPERLSKGLGCFVGPGLNDRFDLKLKKIFEQQLQRHVASDLRASAHRSLGRRLWLAGMLFYPWHARSQSKTFLPGEVTTLLNPKHRRGWWMTVADALILLGENRFLELPKPFWLANLNELAALFHRDRDRERASSSSIGADCLEKIDQGEPVFCLRLSMEGSEIDRGFIVPNGWQARALEMV
jgi:hypothetical protein